MRRFLASALTTALMCAALTTPATAEGTPKPGTPEFVPWSKMTDQEKKAVEEVLLKGQDPKTGKEIQFDSYEKAMEQNTKFLIAWRNEELKKNPEVVLRNCQFDGSDSLKEGLKKEGVTLGKANFSKIFSAALKGTEKDHKDLVSVYVNDHLYEIPPKYQGTWKQGMAKDFKGNLYQCGYITKSGAATGVTSPTAKDLKAIPESFATDPAIPNEGGSSSSSNGGLSSKDSDGNSSSKAGSSDQDKGKDGSSNGPVIGIVVALVAIAGIVGAIASGMVPGVAIPGMPAAGPAA